jgi:hypothetical protein
VADPSLANSVPRGEVGNVRGDWTGVKEHGAERNVPALAAIRRVGVEGGERSEDRKVDEATGVERAKVGCMAIERAIPSCK